MNSLVGRLGFVLSREVKKDTQKAFRYYAKASLLHEFCGDDQITLRDRSNDDRLSLVIVRVAPGMKLVLGLICC